jgi:TIR domain
LLSPWGEAVSDIFISYARPDQQLAQSIADDLKARGFKVWWDTELLGSDDFYDVIYSALSNAKAAIVIWTKNSCHSRFVRDEARLLSRRKS